MALRTTHYLTGKVVRPEAFNYSPKKIRSGLKLGKLRYNYDTDEDVLEKKCKQCGDWLPLSHEFWYSFRCNTSQRDFDQPKCKVCEHANRTDYLKVKAEKDKQLEPVLAHKKLLNSIFK